MLDYNMENGKKVLLIGAGLTGRGFLARLLHQNGCQITFADADRELIKCLSEEGTYTIYLGENRSEYKVRDYSAYPIEDKEAGDAARDADYIFISVGNKNLGNLRSFFEDLCRKDADVQFRIIICENGISPKEEFRNAMPEFIRKQMKLSQGIIFCTSILMAENEGLDILSENYNELPYDVEEGIVIPFQSFVPTENLDALLKRKIYTYNCLSACIAYLGYLKGYTIYAEAANDSEINAFCNCLRFVLDDVLSQALGVELEEQNAFSQKAMRKFCDPTIADTIRKNARDVKRKIAPGERLAEPLNMMIEAGKDCRDLCRVIAAALWYYHNEECEVSGRTSNLDMVQMFANMNCLDPHGDVAANIRKHYNEINDCDGQNQEDKL